MFKCSSQNSPLCRVHTNHTVERISSNVTPSIEHENDYYSKPFVNCDDIVHLIKEYVPKQHSHFELTVDLSCSLDVVLCPMFLFHLHSATQTSPFYAQKTNL